MFTSNFIGVVFSRTLHFQFYVWYFHTLPYLLWSIRMPTILRYKVTPASATSSKINKLNCNRFALLGAIEFVWNVFPSRAETSFLLFVCHLIMLFGLYLRPIFVDNVHALKKTDEPKPKKKAGHSHAHHEHHH